MRVANDGMYPPQKREEKKKGNKPRVESASQRVTRGTLRNGYKLSMTNRAALSNLVT